MPFKDKNKEREYRKLYQREYRKKKTAERKAAKSVQQVISDPIVQEELIQQLNSVLKKINPELRIIGPTIELQPTPKDDGMQEDDTVPIQQDGNTSVTSTITRYQEMDEHNEKVKEGINMIVLGGTPIVTSNTKTQNDTLFDEKEKELINEIQVERIPKIQEPVINISGISYEIITMTNNNNNTSLDILAQLSPTKETTPPLFSTPTIQLEQLVPYTASPEEQLSKRRKTEDDHVNSSPFSTPVFPRPVRQFRLGDTPEITPSEESRKRKQYDADLIRNAPPDWQLSKIV